MLKYSEHVLNRIRKMTETNKARAALVQLVREHKATEEQAESALQFLAVQERRDDKVLCDEIDREAANYFGAPAGEIRADQRGAFQLWLPPGKYVLWVSGQAGTEQAEWFEDVTLLWRSRVNLVEPQCKYSVQ